MLASSQIPMEIAKLLSEQPLAVLATECNGIPHACLMAFVVSPNLRELHFATARNTLKFTNLKSNENVSLLIENGEVRTRGLGAGLALTLNGKAAEIQGAARESALAMLLQKHPGLKDFLTTSDLALVTVLLSNAYLVMPYKKVCFYEFI